MTKHSSPTGRLVTSQPEIQRLPPPGVPARPSSATTPSPATAQHDFSNIENRILAHQSPAK